MTVLFCDLVGSTDLAQCIDPDDLLVALQAYHDAVRMIAARFGGFIARIVGDGVDVYFGYPIANEDDAARALHTALAIVTEVRCIEVTSGKPLSVRIGLATGVVAVSVGQGVIAGTTPNLAARIQASMPEDCIGVSPSTRRIAGAQFQFDDFGVHSLKGFPVPVPISTLRKALYLSSRSASRGRDATQPMIGRDTELTVLQAHWQNAIGGRICGAIVVGDPGLGKSRLITALDQSLPPQGHTVMRLQCSPFLVNVTLGPMVTHLRSASGIIGGDNIVTQHELLEAQLVIAGIDCPIETALIARLMGVPFSADHIKLIPPPMQLQRTKAALKQYFIGLAKKRPLLVVFEDLHWIDSTSLELLTELLDSEGNAPILFLMTARQEFQLPWILNEIFISLTLQRLTNDEARTVAKLQAELPMEWLTTIIERTDGVPLFIEEMTRMYCDCQKSGAQGRVLRVVPDTLMDLLTERLDRLSSAGKLMAQLASVIGRDFDCALLTAAASEKTDGLQTLLDNDLVHYISVDCQRLTFKHALIEDTAYASMSPKLRAEMHARVANTLLIHFKDRVEQQPALAARHLSLAGDGLQAASWWMAAGRKALSRGSTREAAEYLRAGITGLQNVPHSEDRDKAELVISSMLGPITMVLCGPGSAEFGEVQGRSYVLSQTLPGQPRLFSITYGWCLFNWARTKLTTATYLVAMLLDTAGAQESNSEVVMAANNMAGMLRFHLGQAEAAQTHLFRSTALYDPQRDAALYPVYLMDFGVFGAFYLALSYQVLGFPDMARRVASEALLLAESLKQPHSIGFAMLANFNVAVIQGDISAALIMAERCIEFSSQYGFPEFVAMARVARGWAIAHGEHRWEEGLIEVQNGLDGWALTGFENWQPWFTTLEAEIMCHLGLQSLALVHIDCQLARIAVNGERQFESPLLAERAAAFALLEEHRNEATQIFDQASALAHRQGATAWVDRVARRRYQMLAGPSPLF